LYTFRKPFIVLLMLLFIVGTIGCSDDSEIPATPEEAAYKVFGEAKDDGNGIETAAFLPKEETMPARLGIVYHYYPLSGKDIKSEIGINMTRKIKKLYESSPDIDEAVFVIQLPYQDKYGNTTWKKAIQFTFTRDIYEKINWDNFLDSQLLDAVEDVSVK